MRMNPKECLEPVGRMKWKHTLTRQYQELHYDILRK
jgi:hypothetical protein